MIYAANFKTNLAVYGTLLEQSSKTYAVAMTTSAVGSCNQLP